MKNNYGAYLFAGIMFFLAWIGILLSTLIPPYESGLILFKISGGTVVFGLMGFLFLRTAIRRRQRIKKTIANGIPSNATVVQHGRQFNPFSSWRYYTITLQIVDDGKVFTSRVRSTSSSFHSVFPIGGAVAVRFDKSSGTMILMDE